MEPKSKKQKGDEEVVVRDRLSEMPDESIVHILSGMSTLGAVRTTLIRRFGNLWTLVPSLKFDCQEFYGTIYGDEESDMNKVLLRFCCFVRNVLMVHRRSTIDVFRLVICDPWYIECLGPHIIEEVKMWLRFAVEREAKDILLSIQCEEEYIRLPCCLLTSQSLVKLELHACKIEPQHQMIMGSLRKLKLSCCHLTNEVFNQLISGCPSLQELDMEFLLELQDIRITNPSVEKLRLGLWRDTCTLDCPNHKKLEIEMFSKLVNVIDVSSLQEVIIRDLPWQCTLGAIKTFFCK